MCPEGSEEKESWDSPLNRTEPERFYGAPGGAGRMIKSSVQYADQSVAIIHYSSFDPIFSTESFSRTLTFDPSAPILSLSMSPGNFSR